MRREEKGAGVNQVTRREGKGDGGRGRGREGKGRGEL
jgi:hypothetical protein